MTSPDELFAQIGEQARRLGARLEEAAEPRRFEYKLVRWEKVNDLARDGWVMMQAVPVWNPQDGHVSAFVMVRPLTVADEAAELLGSPVEA